MPVTGDVAPTPEITGNRLKSLERGLPNRHEAVGERPRIVESRDTRGRLIDHVARK